MILFHCEITEKLTLKTVYQIKMYQTIIYDKKNIKSLSYNKLNIIVNLPSGILQKLGLDNNKYKFIYITILIIAIHNML